MSDMPTVQYRFDRPDVHLGRLHDELMTVFGDPITVARERGEAAGAILVTVPALIGEGDDPEEIDRVEAETEARRLAMARIVGRHGPVMVRHKLDRPGANVTQLHAELVAGGAPADAAVEHAGDTVWLTVPETVDAAALAAVVAAHNPRPVVRKRTRDERLAAAIAAAATETEQASTIGALKAAQSKMLAALAGIFGAR